MHEPTRRAVCGQGRLSAYSFPLAEFLYALALSLLLMSCQRSPPVGSDVVARVAGEEISYPAFEADLRASVEGSELSLESSALSQLFDQFLDDRLLLRLALDQGLDPSDPDERQAIDFLLREVDEDSIERSAVETYYADNRDRYRRSERVHLRQILLPDRQAAESAQAALAAGEEFAALAVRVSSGPNARYGGDQGRLGRADLPPSFVEVIFALPEGGVSEIIEADYGLHIFQAIAHLPAEVVPLSQAEEEIRRILLGQHVDQIVAGLVAEARGRYGVRVFPLSFPFEYEGHYASQSDE